MATQKNIKENYLYKYKNPLELVVDNTDSIKNPAYWESTLFSEVYLNNDLKRDFNERWDKDFDDIVFDENGNTKKSGFAHFYNEFRNIAPDLKALTNRKLSETDTITKIIAPILNVLGWFDKCESNAQEPYAAETSFTIKGRGIEKDKTYRTDMLLVDDHREATYISEQETSDQRRGEARRYCIVPLEAKYWNRITDQKGNKKFDSKREDKKKDDTGRSFSFNEQVLNYMNILHKNWGIVTDGNTWRLVHLEISEEDSERCFEFKLESLLSKEQHIGESKNDHGEFLELAKYFYLFFGKPSYVKDDIGKVFIDEVLKESRKYIDSIEEDLTDRFISAMNITCNGLLRAAKENGTITKPTEDDLKLIRTVAESHLFNILFIKSCESRSILPTRNPDYYNISLTRIIDRIKDFDPERYRKSRRDRDYINQKLLKSLNGSKFKPEGTNLYKNLIKLTEVIHEGTEKYDYGFEIKGFKESVFSKIEWNFSKKHCLTDAEMVQVLFQLGYSKSNKTLQRNYRQIPYNYFTPRQLGSIYESFLEYQLDVAQEPMVYLKKGKHKQWIKLTAAIERKLKGCDLIVKNGQLFFTPNNSERKATGSYYTPDYIVQYIVRETISPLCEGKSSKEILELKVCDPAMGSGHFLTGALNFLTREYLKALELEKPSEDIPTKEEAKRIVLDKCIYGMDINPRAVKLAKMSLWLESAHPGKKLERLDDQLFEQDTLKLEKPIVEDISAYIGNPPWVLKRDSDLTEEYKKYIQLNYKSAEGFKKNIFSLFVERVCKWSGDFSVNLVLPDRLLVTPSYIEARKIALKSFTNTKVTILPEESFEDVTASYITFHLYNSKNDIGSIKIYSFKEDSMKVHYNLNELGTNFKINIHRNPSLAPFIEKLNKISKPLSDSYFCHVGMMVKDNKNEFARISDKKRSTRIVKGHCLGKLEVDFTYFFNPNSVTIFGGTKRKKKHAVSPKLLVRKTGNYILSSIDKNSKQPIYAEQSVYLVIPKNQTATENIDIINIYLNTFIPTLYFRNELITNPNSYPYIQQYDLEQIPIPRVLLNDKILISKIRDKIKKCNNKSLALDRVCTLLCSSLDLPLEKSEMLFKIAS